MWPGFRRLGDAMKLSPNIEGIIELNIVVARYGSTLSREEDSSTNESLEV